MKTTNILLKLERGTGGCQIGPIVVHKPGKIDLWYDSEGDDSVVWTHVHFSSVVGFRFTPETGVDETMVTAYSKIIELPGSEWINTLEMSASERHQRLMTELRHMMLFFDHHGCLEVIARTVEYENDKKPDIEL